MVALPNRTAYEDKIVALLNKTSEERRKELLAYLGDPPNASRVPKEFWDRLHKDAEIALAVVLMIAVSSQIRAERWTPPDDEWQPVDDYAQSWATWRAQQTAAGYVETTRNRVQGLIERLTRQSPDSRPSPLDVAAELESIIGENRNRTIARTEVTAGQSAGSNWVGDQWRNMGRTVDRIWRLGPTETHCKTCWAVRDTGENFWRNYPGAETGPPLHPRCCCDLQLVLLPSRNP